MYKLKLIFLCVPREIFTCLIFKIYMYRGSLTYKIQNHNISNLKWFESSTHSVENIYQSLYFYHFSGYSLERLMLKLKLKYFDHLVQKANSLEKTLVLGRIEGKRGRVWQKMRRQDIITDSIDMSLSKRLDRVKDRRAWHAAVHGVAKSPIQLGE